MKYTLTLAIAMLTACSSPESESGGFDCDFLLSLCMFNNTPTCLNVKIMPEYGRELRMQFDSYCRGDL